MKFEVIERKRNQVSTKIDASVFKWRMTFSVYNDTGKVFYPVGIIHVKSGLEIYIESPESVSVKVPEYMKDKQMAYVAKQMPLIPHIVSGARECIAREEQHTVNWKPELEQERCMELLNSVINHVSVANNTSETIMELLMMGFTTEELVTYFMFSQSDVDDIAEEMESEE